MRPPPSTDDDSVSSEARLVFVEYLLEWRSRGEADIEAFCLRSPDCADELRRLHRSWQAAGEGGSWHGEEEPGSGASDSGGTSGPGQVEVSGEMLADLERFGDLSRRFQVQEEIARGGMGAIYRVWDEKLRRTLAMKVMVGRESPEGSRDARSLAREQPRLFARFLEEAQITGQLDHPGIVPVQEMGVDEEGRLFFTMKLVKGRDFKKVLEAVRDGKQGWSTTRALGVILKVCEAMAFAHAKGVIHRDLKPSNIMVGRFGETYVMDWGLAKVLGEEGRESSTQASSQASRLQVSLIQTRRTDEGSSRHDSQVTMDGDVVGTPSYMAPEQALGLLDEVGPRSDVYAVGCLLYHLLTGRGPYTPADGKISAVTVLRLLVDGPPKPVTEIAPDVPPELVAICEKAMAREVLERYSSLEAMGEELRAYLEGRVVAAYRTGAVAEFKKWVARNRGVAAGIAASIVLAVGGLIAVALIQQRARSRLAAANLEIQANLENARESEREAQRERARADENARAAEVEALNAAASAARAQANAREADRRTYVASLLAADVSLSMHDVGEARRRLEDCPEDLRGWEWDHLDSRVDASLMTLREHVRDVETVLYSPDGTLLASGGADGVVVIWDGVSGERIAVLDPGQGGVKSLVFSGDGVRLAVGCEQGRITVFDVLSGEVLRRLEGDEEAVSCLAHHPHRPLLVSGGRTGKLRVWDVDSGLRVTEFAASESPIVGLAFRPDGRRLASAGRARFLRFWKTDSWEHDQELMASLAPLSTMAWSADGKRIATGALDGSLRIVNAITRKTQYVIEAHEGRIDALAFSPDGRELVSVGRDRGVRVWEVRSGEQRSTVHGHVDRVTSAAFRPDGRRLATGSVVGTVRLWNLGLDVDVLAPNFLSVSGVGLTDLSFDPRSGNLVVAGFGGVVWLLDGELGRPIRPYYSEPARIHAVEFSPDGSSLAAAKDDGALVLWDANEQVPRRVLRPDGEPGPPRSLAWSPDGTRLASGWLDTHLRIHDAKTGAQVGVSAGHEGSVERIAWAPDGAWLASASADGTVRRWDSATLEVLDVLKREDEAGGVSSLAISPDGKRLALGRTGFRMTQGMFLRPTAAALEVWDVASGRSVLRLLGHLDTITSVAFGRAGRRLVSASRDRTLRLWDAETGDGLLVFRDFEQPVLVTEFSPDGLRLAAAGEWGELRIRDTRPARVQSARREEAELHKPKDLPRLLGTVDRIFYLIGEAVEQEKGLRSIAVSLSFTNRDPLLLERIAWATLRFEGATEEHYRTACAVLDVADYLAGETDAFPITRAAGHLRCGEPGRALEVLERSGSSGQLETAGVEGLALAALVHRALGNGEASRRAWERLQERFPEALEHGDDLLDEARRAALAP